MDKNNNANKKILNKNLLERIIIIDNLIKTGKYPTNKSIREYILEEKGYKVGEATISRDINYLRVYFGASIDYDPLKKGYYYSKKFDFALSSLTPTDVMYLSTAKKLLSSFSNTPLYNEISKVINIIIRTCTEPNSQLINRIAVPPLPQIVVDENVWNTIVSSINTNHVLEFDYSGRWNPNVKHRKVHPYQILLEDGMYYLFGYDENVENKSGNSKNSERLFCIPRIKNVKVTNKEFVLPKDYDFSSRCSGGRFGSFIEVEQYQYRIEFYDDARQYIKDCVWADDQKIVDDEVKKTSTITFTSSQSLKVMEWILAQGANARPLAPKWFVEEWKDNIKNLYALIRK